MIWARAPPSSLWPPASGQTLVMATSNLVEERKGRGLFNLSVSRPQHVLLNIFSIDSLFTLMLWWHGRLRLNIIYFTLFHCCPNILQVFAKGLRKALRGSWLRIRHDSVVCFIAVPAGYRYSLAPCLIESFPHMLHTLHPTFRILIFQRPNRRCHWNTHKY